MNRPQVVYFPTGQLVYFPSGVRIREGGFRTESIMEQVVKYQVVSATRSPSLSC
jgi:hypothetical protein